MSNCICGKPKLNNRGKYCLDCKVKKIKEHEVRPRKKVKKKECWQKHHITYEPEVIVRVTRAEHFYLTRLMRFNAFSNGFREALKAVVGVKPIKHEELYEKLKGGI